MASLNSNDIKVRMEKALDALKKDLSSLRVGRASSTMLDTINVNAYGSIMPLNQISTISVPESRLLLVSVWDNSLVAITEKSIRESPLGLNPMVEGNVIRLSIPPLSEDRRIEITKIASKYSENAKIAVRNIRRDIIENIRKLQKNSEISEDQKHKDEAIVQEITDEIIKTIDLILSNKEKEILVKKSESVFIPVWEKHRLENPWKIPLSVIKQKYGAKIKSDAANEVMANL